MEFGEQRRICVPGSFENVRKLARFCRSCCGSVFGPNETGLVELAIVEAANNIVSHAYSGRKEQPVEFSVKRLAAGFEFTLIDSGETFDPKSAPSPDFSWDGIDDVPEEGRGLFNNPLRDGQSVFLQRGRSQCHNNV